MSSPSASKIESRLPSSRWTRIHPIFAIGQVGAFVASLVVIALFFTGRAGFDAVVLSVLLKIALMLGAMVTGALWEHDVYGRYWFAVEYFIEDVMTLNVFAVHVLFVACAYLAPGNRLLSLVVLGVAYVLYAANVGQYVWRHALERRDGAAEQAVSSELAA